MARGRLQLIKAFDRKEHAENFMRGNIILRSVDYYKEKEAYLQSQLGNPEGDDKPNKKYYDPRVWLRKGSESMVERLMKAFKELNAIDVL